MGDRPRLPPVSTLLQMTEMDTEFSSHRNERRPHRPSSNFDGGYLSASFSHHRGRPTAADPVLSNSSRHRRPDVPTRGSSSAGTSRSTGHSQRGSNLLPPISEVLQSANAGMEYPHASTAHGHGSAPTSRNPPHPQLAGPSNGQGGHPCERCGRMFTRKSDAVKHKRVVHDKIKTYTCRECGRKFARKDYCTKHEKSLHNINLPPTQYQIRRQLARQQAESRREGR